MSKSNDPRFKPDRERDGTRSLRAKSRTVARKQQRTVKRAIREGGR